MKNLLPQDDPGNWPEPNNDYFNTCGACEVTFIGPKRAHLCYIHQQEAEARHAEATAAYEEAHKDKSAERYFGESSIFMYRNGWIAGWMSLKYPKSTK